MSLSSFFENLVLSLPSKVLTALGMGWISFSGYKALMDAFITQIITDYNSMPVAVYQIASLAGFTDGIGIILGAYSAIGTIWTFKVLGNIA